jgi:hypothetical protein
MQDKPEGLWEGQAAGPEHHLTMGNHHNNKRFSYNQYYHAKIKLLKQQNF